MTRSTYMLHRVFERFTSGLGAIVLTACMLMVSDARAASADSIYVAPSVTVKYSPGSLASEKGASDVYRKLRFAARKVCGISPGVTSLERRMAGQKCYDKTLAEAVRRVDRPVLSALHESATGRSVS